MRDWARELTMPTLLVNRDDDPLAPVAEMEELARLLPNCHGLTVLRDGGRFVTYTHAEEVNALLGDFFRAVAAPEPAGERQAETR
jgi:pimeloyl-ACP methyl ester carboxylesterase